MRELEVKADGKEVGAKGELTYIAIAWEGTLKLDVVDGYIYVYDEAGEHIASFMYNSRFLKDEEA